MIFSEIYGAYYNAVAAILRRAVAQPISKDELRKTIEAYAFSESVLTIEPALTGERWPLLNSRGESVLQFAPTMPLTLLQRRWLKAISLDPRIRLFSFDAADLADVPPLFTPDDIYIFDRYADGDPFADEAYIRTFRLILSAMQARQPLRIDVKNRRGNTVRLVCMPEHLEYSEKDDKFRLITSGCRHGAVVNLGRILACEPLPSAACRTYQPKPALPVNKSVVLELYDERNALERALLHFAHFEKEARRLDEKRYRITIQYRQNDETELVIRVLSFGPFLKVTEPESFVTLIKNRLQRQKSCELT